MGSFRPSHQDADRHSYASSSATHTPFRLDEGFSEDASSQDENGRNSTAARFQEWVMAQNEEARAEIAYEVLRTLRTFNIAAVVERMTPLLHMDPLEKLPPEITAQIFSYLDAHTLMTASMASRTWRARVLDNMLWQELFKSQGWGINWSQVGAFESAYRLFTRRELDKSRGPLHGQPQHKRRATAAWRQSRSRKASADVSQWREQHGPIEADTDMQSEPEDQEMHDAPTAVSTSPQRPNKRHSQESGDEMEDYSPSSSDVSSGEDNGRRQASLAHGALPTTRLTTADPSGIEKLNWLHLYKQRQRLEHNWSKARFTTFQLPHPLYPHEAHTECVYTIQFFGKWLVSGSRDKTLRIWDLETRRLRGKPLTGHSQSVLCLQFDPTEDEDVIISGSSDASVVVWRFSTGQKMHEIPSAHEESVLNLRFDHRYLITCSKDRRIKIWNRRQLTATDADYPKPDSSSAARVPSYIVNIDDMAPSLVEARMASGVIRPLKPYTLLLTLEGHSAAVNAIQIKGDLIVSASGDRLIKVWSTRNGLNLRTLQGHHKGIACVQFDSKRIVSGSSDNTIRIYDPYSGAEVAELKGHTNLVRTVQAGFGDLPGGDEEDSTRAKEAERKYLEDVASGLIVEDREYSRGLRNGAQGTSRLALGAKLPPGGGGSKWGRIVSGSYDQTIIIWRKNSDGDWVVGQRLRHEPVLQGDEPPSPPLIPPGPAALPQAAPPTQTQPAASTVGLTGSHNQSTMSASQIVQNAMGTSFASLGAGLSNVMGLGRALNAPLGGPRPGLPLYSRISATSSAGTGANNVAASASAQIQGGSDAMQHVVGHAMPQPASNASLNLNHAQAHHVPGSILPMPNRPTTLPAQMLQPPAPHVPIPVAQPAPTPAAGQQTQQRVFKLQFDARRIICCSQDSRIVGWDFANGDPDIAEACRFFLGP